MTKRRAADLVLYAFLVVLALIVLLAGSTLALLTNYRHEMSVTYAAMSQRTGLANTVREIVSDRSTRLHRIVMLAGSAERAREIEQYNDLLHRYADTSRHLAGLLASAEEKNAFESMTRLADHGWRMQDEVIELLNQGEQQAAVDALLNTVLPVQDDVLEQVGVFNGLQRMQAQKLQDDLRQRYWLAVALGTLVTLLIISSAWLITHLVRRRVGEAEASAEDYAARLQRYADHLEDMVAARTQDLANARDEAVRANEAKGLFLANMSHELRTPLSAIIGYCGMMREDMSDRGETRSLKDLGKMEEAARALLDQINAILDLTKLEAGHVPQLEITAIDARAMLGKIVDTVRPMAESHGNTIHVDIAAEPDTLLGDETLLRHSLLNVIANACKFTEKGTISVSLDRDRDQSWRFCVRDTGIGMTMEQLRVVFEPFVQADSSTTRRFGGTGLGLPLARQYIALLGGWIDAESTPGIGSAFTIHLPPGAPTASPEDGA
jgi:signal transduction histidine kinase